MKQYAHYAEYLRRLVKEAHSSPDKASERVEAALNGEAKRKLGEAVPLQQRRAAGAFFTPQAIADLAATNLKRELRDGACVYDPACGAGDLLLACTNHLPTQNSLAATLTQWGRQLLGTDIHEEFVRAARARLTLAAIDHKKTSGAMAQKRFAGIESGCGLGRADALTNAQAVIMNPPFCRIQTPEGTTWTSGTVCSSAVFLDHVASAAKPRTKIVAVLPDVIRSGSRYEQLRSKIAKTCSVISVTPLSRFDRHTDVHVFLLVLRKLKTPKRNGATWPAGVICGADSVGDKFQVSVGPVVDYRDPKKGPWSPFFRASGLPAWSVVRREYPKRRFSGRIVKPPVVVIRRTSRPEDKFRAIGTIIAGKTSVAVENHLIILQPKDGLLRTCRELLSVLQADQATEWLNRRIRCRHLTVDAIRDLPWVSSSRVSSATVSDA